MHPTAPSSPIKAVLFDVDGTLVDTLPALIPGLQDAYEKFASFRPAEDVIRKLIGLPLAQQMRLFQMHEPTTEALAERVEFTIGRFEAYKDRERAFEPAIQALSHLSRAGFKIALVTSKSKPEVELFLGRFEGAAFVDAVVCADDVENPKPSPDCVQLACELLSVSPSESVLIGDSIYDMQSAKRAGVAMILAVTYGAGEISSLLAEMPDCVFETPEEVYSWASELSQSHAPKQEV